MKINAEHFNGLIYATTLAIAVGLIMLEAWIFNLTDPTWAIVSGVICTELEINQTRQLVFGRIVATLVGVTLAFLMLESLGPGYIAVIAGVILTTLVCQYAINLGNHWKFATATGAIILVAGLHAHSVAAVETIAYKRAIEVTMGSITAGIVSLIVGHLSTPLKNSKNKD